MTDSAESPIVVLFEDRPKQSMVFQLNLSVYLDAQVVVASSESDLKRALAASGGVQLVVARAMFKGAEIAGTILKTLGGAPVPVICLGDQKELPGITVVPNDTEVRPLLQAAAKILAITAQKMVSKQRPDTYSIRPEFFNMLFSMPCNVFVATAGGREKLFSAGEAVPREKISRLVRQKKALEIDSLQRLKLANAVTEQSLKATAELNADSLPETQKMSILSASLDMVAAQFQSAGMDEETVKLADASIKAVEKIAESATNVGSLVKQLMEAEGGYRYAHSQLITFLGFHVIKMMGWWGDEQRSIISQAAFYHDISLTTDDESKIRSAKSLAASANKDPAFQELILTHAQLAARELQSAPEISPEVVRVVIQHHGSPVGRGFSTDIGKLDNLAKTFVLAEEWCDYLMDIELSGVKPDNSARLAQLKTIYKDEQSNQILETFRYLDPKEFSQDFLSDKEVDFAQSLISGGAETTSVVIAPDPSGPEDAETVSADPFEEEVKRLVKGGMPEAEAQTLVKGGKDDEAELERLVKGGMPEAEAKTTVKGKRDAAAVEKLVRGGKTQAEAEIFVKGGGLEAAVARLVKGGMSEAEAETLVKGGSPEEVLERLVKGGMPEADAKVLVKAGKESVATKKGKANRKPAARPARPKAPVREPRKAREPRLADVARAPGPAGEKARALIKKIQEKKPNATPEEVESLLKAGGISIDVETTRLVQAEEAAAMAAYSAKFAEEEAKFAAEMAKFDAEEAAGVLSGVTDVRNDDEIHIKGDGEDGDGVVRVSGGPREAETKRAISGTTDVRLDEKIVIKGDKPQDLVDRSITRIKADDKEKERELKLKALAGHSELMKAALSGTLEKVAEILAAASNMGVEMRKTDAEGRTVMHYAAMGGFCNVLKLLVEKGGQYNTADSKRRTPLFFAALYKQNDAFDMLLAQGAKINQQAMGGMTIAMVGAFSGNMHILKAALDRGVRADVKDHAGKTALDFAKQGKQTEAIALLEAAQAALDAAKPGAKKAAAAA